MHLHSNYFSQMTSDRWAHRFIVELDSNWFCSCLIQMLITGFGSIATNRESGRLSRFLYMRHTTRSSINISRDNLNHPTIICRSSTRFFYITDKIYQLQNFFYKKEDCTHSLHTTNTYNELWILISFFDNCYCNSSFNISLIIIYMLFKIQVKIVIFF